MGIKSSAARLTELRRLLPLAAAVLFVAALLFPMWRITLQAPQYTDDLVVELFAYPRVAGDYAEVARLNQYVGFYYPDPVFVEPNYPVHENAVAVPEWSFGPLAFIGVALTGIFVALAPTERKLKLGLTAQLVGTITVFAGMFAIIQYRLHQAGHSLDPNAPLGGVDGFTPPVIGSYEVANINGFAWIGIGGEMAMAAVGLLIVAYFLRDTDATIRDTPELMAQMPQAVSTRLRGVSDRTGRNQDDVEQGEPEIAEQTDKQEETENPDGSNPTRSS